MNDKVARIRTLVSCLALVSTPAMALDGSLLGIDYCISGFIRAELAAKTVSEENPYNQRGNLFNQVPVERRGALPQTKVLGSPTPTTNDTAVRNGIPADNDFNFTQLRMENTFQFRFGSNWSATVKFRGIFDAAVYDEFEPEDVNSQAVGYLYGEPNYFEYDDFEKGGVQNRLEWAGEDYMIDIPTAYIDYQNGPLLIRAGNQQIAWGQALFFRVMDVANGLDLRRHLILDFAS